jgi:hypothetical protein
VFSGGSGGLTAKQAYESAGGVYQENTTPPCKLNISSQQTLETTPLSQRFCRWTQYTHHSTQNPQLSFSCSKGEYMGGLACDEQAPDITQADRCRALCCSVSREPQSPWKGIVLDGAELWTGWTDNHNANRNNRHNVTAPLAKQCPDNHFASGIQCDWRGTQRGFNENESCRLRCTAATGEHKNSFKGSDGDCSWSSWTFSHNDSTDNAVIAPVGMYIAGLDCDEFAPKEDDRCRVKFCPAVPKK